MLVRLGQIETFLRALECERDNHHDRTLPPSERRIKRRTLTRTTSSRSGFSFHIKDARVKFFGSQSLVYVLTCTQTLLHNRAHCVHPRRLRNAVLIPSLLKRSSWTCVVYVCVYCSTTAARSQTPGESACSKVQSRCGAHAKDKQTRPLESAVHLLSWRYSTHTPK